MKAVILLFGENKILKEPQIQTTILNWVILKPNRSDRLSLNN